MIVKPFELDKNNVKRIFTFGCSFTNFFWPTWANIVSKEIDHAEFYNFGKSGLGNLGISAKISEAHYRFNFSESDLVMIMWSTFLREDRWVTGSWFGAGNVFSTGMYDEYFREHYADVCGYLIRDGALINMCKHFLEKLPCKVIMMPSVPFDYIDSYVRYDSETYEKIIKLYQPLFDSMPKSLFDHLRIGTGWPLTHSYYWSEMNGLHHDNHPSPNHALDYLRTYVMNFSDKTTEYAELSTKKLLSLTTKEQIVNEFEYDTKEYLLF